MSAKTKHLHPGYVAALDAAKAKSGRCHGVAAWLAAEVGISRQRLFSYRKRGFAQSLIPKIAKVTGLPEETVQHTLNFDVQHDTWRSLCEITPKTLIDQFVSNTTKRRRHGKG